jgi:lactate racemase
MATIRIPWGAWFDESELALPLPAGWEVDTVAVDGGARGPGLDEALSAPIDAPKVEELARGRRTAAIAVEDITRPAPCAAALESLLARLAAGGIGAGSVRVIIATGGHGPLRLPDLLLKVGRRVLDECDVSNHHPYENLVDLGRSPGGLPVRVNRLFAEADVKLAVGSVMPHPYAGFGGGGKIVLPGLAGIETLEMNHRPAVTGLAGAGVGVVEGNRARAEMEEIAIAAGLAAVLNIVPGPRREPLGHYYGHPVAAHRAAVRHALRAYGAPVRPGADLVVLNAYPKDGELLQVGNVFNAWRALDPPPGREGGTVVVTAACPLGRGYHSLHGPGMRLYRDPVPRPYLEGRELIVFAPTLGTADVRVSFWEGYRHARTWGEVLETISARHPAGGRALVFETAPMALPRACAPAEGESAP